ncbi:vacuolar protein-sorting-associated protein [Anaeramoeba ignava]|uniref:Vacuolar protein-sorting-associated protein 25 n=1 Tax=Anaeramoeba ignava TaxID=1746090 RepID=A0A9Q0R609_ANAIG|nr:vacuolar protein-sorting-associated protein [Anaeramoeba ignava]|eukprot:Anaeramoba_ignava/a222971_56.p1 GENE.a222971_56~~a222971_56.p1  ORF type:complete len:180 (+),score=49.42 a222971_56:40-579(+)
MNNFNFPSYYNLPPFFTIQPVQATREKQLKLWIDLVLAFTKHFKKYTIDIQEDSKSSLFNNEKINRNLNDEGIRLLLEELVKHGHGEWLDKSKASCRIIWRTFDEWGKMIYKWADKNGLVGQVCTVYEIREGDLAQEEEFYGLDYDTTIKALEALEKQNLAKIFKSENSDETGVKFFTQ